MAEARNTSDREPCHNFDAVSPMTESEMRTTFGGAGRTLLDEWAKLCAEDPYSAPCTGRS